MQRSTVRRCHLRDFHAAGVTRVGPADPFADDGEGGLCGRLLDMETEPLRKEIDELRAENEELKMQLAAATEELVHEEL